MKEERKHYKKEERERKFCKNRKIIKKGEKIKK
jgi:hypothetical protein